MMPGDAKRKLPCEYLRCYGKPGGLLTLFEICETSYGKQKEEDRILKKTLAAYEYPENLSENEMLDFLYLRACVWLNEKPVGDFEGSARICADVLQRGGNIADMRKAGASAAYAACLSHHALDTEIQREIIDAHIPF